MKLMTRQLEKRFAKVGSQDYENDPVIVARYYNPGGCGTWYASDYDPVEKRFFGYVSIFGDWNDGWGDFSLKELETHVNDFGVGVVRDLNWKECKASKVRR